MHNNDHYILSNHMCVHVSDITYQNHSVGFVLLRVPILRAFLKIHFVIGFLSYHKVLYILCDVTQNALHIDF